MIWHAGRLQKTSRTQQVRIPARRSRSQVRRTQIVCYAVLLSLLQRHEKRPWNLQIVHGSLGEGSKVQHPLLISVRQSDQR